MTRHSAAGPYYPAHSRGRLTPDAILNVRFRAAGGLRGGVDPNDVQSFITRVADDMASLYRELAEVHAENHRVKAALAAWQKEQAPAPDYGAHRRLR